MKKIIALAFFVGVTAVGFAQYNQVNYGPNGNKISEGQYSANPGIQPNDSKETIAQKIGMVHKTGTWKYWFDNGQLSAEETYDNNGIPTGTWKTYFNDGHLASEVNYAAGTAVYYYQNGAKAEQGNINVSNQRIGAWQGWHENGNLNYTGSYNTAGQKNGDWKFYDPNGTITATQHYTNDVLQAN